MSSDDVRPARFMNVEDRTYVHNDCECLHLPPLTPALIMTYKHAIDTCTVTPALIMTYISMPYIGLRVLCPLFQQGNMQKRRTVKRSKSLSKSIVQ